jgi:hypothetical protein
VDGLRRRKETTGAGAGAVGGDVGRKAAAADVFFWSVLSYLTSANPFLFSRFP